jgi:hypothetical protein
MDTDKLRKPHAQVDRFNRRSEFQLDEKSGIGDKSPFTPRPCNGVLNAIGLSAIDYRRS